MSRPLEDQSALVTGAGRGIGRAIALRLAAAGARVTLVARTQPQLDAVAAEIGASGGEALAVAADVRDAGAVARAVAATTERFGPVAILVNDAAAPGPYGPIGVVDPRDWWAAQEIHVLGPLLFMHAVLPAMRCRRAGRIINMVSSVGLLPMPNLSAYCVGKGTLLRLTETVDLEQRDHGIRAFALHPGTIITEMARDTMASAEARLWVPEGVAMLESRQPEDSAADLARCVEVAVALASGRYDALAGQYLESGWDLDQRSRAGSAPTTG